LQEQVHASIPSSVGLRDAQGLKGILDAGLVKLCQAPAAQLAGLHQDVCASVTIPDDPLVLSLHLGHEALTTLAQGMLLLSTPVCGVASRRHSVLVLDFLFSFSLLLSF